MGVKLLPQLAALRPNYSDIVQMFSLHVLLHPDRSSLRKFGNTKKCFYSREKHEGKTVTLH